MYKERNQNKQQNTHSDCHCALCVLDHVGCQGLVFDWILTWLTVSFSSRLVKAVWLQNLDGCLGPGILSTFHLDSRTLKLLIEKTKKWPIAKNTFYCADRISCLWPPLWPYHLYVCRPLLLLKTGLHTLIESQWGGACLQRHSQGDRHTAMGQHSSIHF